MSSAEWEVLSSLVDGEEVDPNELENVLAQPPARTFLVDCVRLRREVRTDARLCPEIEVELRQRVGLDRRRRSWLTAVGLGAALLAVVLWLAAPYRQPQQEALPVPDRVIELEPGRDWIG